MAKRKRTHAHIYWRLPGVTVTRVPGGISESMPHKAGSGSHW
jgi:hypothetical protein